MTHLLAAAALVPFLGVEHADARQKAVGSVNRSKSPPRYAARRSQTAVRRVRQPVPRRSVVRAPRNRLEEGWPYGYMDPRWYTDLG